MIKSPLRNLEVEDILKSRLLPRGLVQYQFNNSAAITSCALALRYLYLHLFAFF